MKIGVITALQMEVDNLQATMKDVTTETHSGVTFVCGTIGDREVVAAVCGVGKVFAAICSEAMILLYHVDMIVGVGVAGALTGDLGILDVAVADQVVQHDMNTTALGDPVGLLSGLDQIFLPADEGMRRLLCECLDENGISYKVGTIATGDLYLHKPEQRILLNKRFGAIAAEMEGGSIGHVCFVNQVPFAIMRTISDDKAAATDYETFAERAAAQSTKVLAAFIERAGSAVE